MFIVTDLNQSIDRDGFSVYTLPLDLDYAIAIPARNLPIANLIEAGLA